MDSLYKHLNEKKFKILTILFCILADAFIVAHIVMSIGNQAQFEKTMANSMEIVQQNNPELVGQLPPNFVAELWQVMITTMVGVIALYLLFHGLIYFMHHYKKGFARGYIAFYSWTGSVLMLLYSLVNVTTLTKAMFIIPGLMLLYVAIGLQKFPHSKTEVK
jgi:hypothetical protein